MQKLLKDPLLHFLILGAALFAWSSWRSAGDDPERIVITAEEVERLRNAAALVQGRAPTEEELAEIIEPTIRDEVYYREALALGLDVDDDEVRRRLIEKMQYLTSNLADPAPASEEELKAFYAARPELFTVPERVTFEQVFFSPQMRGEAVESEAAAALERLRTGTNPAEAGDRTPLALRFDEAPRERVAVLFGDALTAAVFSMAPGDWQGPYRSDFGLHVIRLIERAPARLPPYEEIRDRVLATYGEEKRAERNAAEYARMRARYEVVIERPAADESPDKAAP